MLSSPWQRSSSAAEGASCAPVETIGAAGPAWILAGFPGAGFRGQAMQSTAITSGGGPTSGQQLLRCPLVQGACAGPAALQALLNCWNRPLSWVKTRSITVPLLDQAAADRWPPKARRPFFVDDVAASQGLSSAPGTEVVQLAQNLDLQALLVTSIKPMENGPYSEKIRDDVGKWTDVLLVLLEHNCRCHDVPALGFAKLRPQASSNCGAPDLGCWLCCVGTNGRIPGIQRHIQHVVTVHAKQQVLDFLGQLDAVGDQVRPRQLVDVQVHDAGVISGSQPSAETPAVGCRTGPRHLPAPAAPAACPSCRSWPPMRPPYSGRAAVAAPVAQIGQPQLEVVQCRHGLSTHGGAAGSMASAGVAIEIAGALVAAVAEQAVELSARQATSKLLSA